GNARHGERDGGWTDEQTRVGSARSVAFLPRGHEHRDKDVRSELRLAAPGAVYYRAILDWTVPDRRRGARGAEATLVVTCIALGRSPRSPNDGDLTSHVSTSFPTTCVYLLHLSRDEPMSAVDS